MTARKLGDYTLNELDQFIGYVNSGKDYANFYANDGHIVLKVGNTTIQADDPFDMVYWKTKSRSDKMGRDVKDLVCAMIGSIHKDDNITFHKAMGGTKYYIEVVQHYPFYGRKTSYAYSTKDDYVCNQFRSKKFEFDIMYTVQDIFNM